MRRLAKAFLGALLGWLARLFPRRVGVALLHHGIADDDHTHVTTARHDFLSGLAPEELDASVRGGREEIEAVAGRPVRIFAYPSGGRAATAPIGNVAEFSYVLARTLWESPR